MIIGLVGISGVGKSYIKKEIIRAYDFCDSLVAVTTRKQRKNEVNGIDKFFLTEDEFDKRIDEIDIITRMYGYRYGFWKKDLTRDNLKIVELYYKDIPKIKRYSVKTVLVKTSNFSKLFSIMLKRYGLSKELLKRICIDCWIYTYLMINRKEFDYIIDNDYSETSVEQVSEIVKSFM